MATTIHLMHAIRKKGNYANKIDKERKKNEVAKNKTKKKQIDKEQMLTLLVVNQNLPEPAQNAHRVHSLQTKKKTNKQTATK